MRAIKRLIIVDGFNVLRCGEAYREIVGEAPNFNDWQNEEFNRAREQLLDDAALLAAENTQVVIVYDGMRNEFSDAKPAKIGNVTVVFSAFEFSADDEIECRVFAARERGCEVTVVTNDTAIAQTVEHGKVARMHVEEFCQAVAGVGGLRDEARDYDNAAGTSKVKGETIQNRVSPHTAHKLNKLFDELNS